MQTVARQDSMKKAPMVYNPMYLSLQQRIDSLPRAEQEKELAKVLVGQMRQMKENILPFFEQRDDPRPGPKSAEEAIEWLRDAAPSALQHASDASLAEYAFELDFVFRLLRFVIKENPFLHEEATRLAAALCKCCLTFSGAYEALEVVLDFFASKGIGRRVAAIDNLCAQCNKPLSGQMSVFNGARYHAACFVCCQCSRGLNGISFTLDRASGRPICVGGCGPQRAVPHTTTHLDRNSYAQPALAAISSPVAKPHIATHVHIDTDSPSLSVSSAHREWTCEDVVRKLQELNVTDVEAFRQEAIDGTALASLTDADLRDELKLKLGDRKKVSELIASLK